MRQAGRYLPEYRALKAKHNFLKMVRTPDLAAEVTLQPMRRFPQLDAAIVFSDILVIPEALGQGYRFKEEGGIAMDWRVERWEQVDRLTVELVPERLRYVAEALKRTREQLGADRALLGFCGSPWTLAAYMIEGGGSDDFARAKALLYGDRPLFDKLMEKLVRALVAYVRMQIEAGADAIQIFDSWAGILPAAEYEQASLRWTRQLIAALPKGFPVILYAKGAAASLPALGTSGAAVLGLDWTVDLAVAKRALPAPRRRAGQPRPRAAQHDPGQRRRRRREAARLDARPARPHLQPRPRHPPRGEDRLRRSPLRHRHRLARVNARRFSPGRQARTAVCDEA